MTTKTFKIALICFCAAFLMTACSLIQKDSSDAPTANVSDEETLAAMEEVAGIIMSGPVEVQTLVANEPGAAFAVATSASAEVVIKAINARKRLLTIETQDGQTKKYTAGPAIKNFDKLKAGDTVVATFTEIMAVYLGQDAAPSADAAAGLARKGDGTPGAALFGEAQVTAKVRKLDKTTRQIKLELPDDRVRVAKVREGIDLSKVEVGDTVTVAIANALMIDVVQ